MKRWLMFSVMVVALCLAVGAWAQEDIKKHPSCKYCGMDREKFAYSRVFIEYDDGSTEGLCSIHCAVVDLALHIDKTPKVIWVGDLNTKKLIDVDKAVWVVGGNKPGVMTQRAKWAFEKKADAEKFIKANGGSLKTFDEVIHASYEDMDADTKMIRQRRKMMKMKKSAPKK